MGFKCSRTFLPLPSARQVSISQSQLGKQTRVVTRGDNIGQILISGHRNSQFLITLNQTVLACTIGGLAER